ncbi:MAG: hypothetical protein AAF870_05455 [Pseudomonadota bacterium]
MSIKYLVVFALFAAPSIGMAQGKCDPNSAFSSCWNMIVPGNNQDVLGAFDQSKSERNERTRGIFDRATDCINCLGEGVYGHSWNDGRESSVTKE